MTHREAAAMGVGDATALNSAGSRRSEGSGGREEQEH